MTDIEKVRVLIGDTQATEFADSDIQVYLDIEGGDLLLSAALALDTLVARADVTPHQVSIGKFQYSAGRTQIRQLTQQAEAFRKRAYETPAFAIAEENLSEFNQLILIRNWILKTIP